MDDEVLWRCRWHEGGSAACCRRLLEFEGEDVGVLCEKERVKMVGMTKMMVKMMGVKMMEKMNSNGNFG